MTLKANEMEAAEEESRARSCIDEDSINFRPSPNFKHMKKYLKVHKLEEEMIEANSSSGEENTSLLTHNKLEKDKNALVATAAAQPPLPPNPPPPDTPPMIINVKQEIEDDEYTCSITETSSDLEHSGEPKAAAATMKADSEEKPGVTMCRNFARGTCKKGAACIFAHELILSQLPGVYTFCRNFQNSVCSFPKCKFVHATVFEKEHFYRTGYLPPHTLAHLKEASVQAPPPQSEETSTGVPPIYSNTAPTTSTLCVPPAVVQNIAEAGAEQGDPNIYSHLQSTTTSTSITSPKRIWSEIDKVTNSTGVVNSGEPLAKKCKNCDSNELREQLMKAKIEKCARANKELAQKIAQVKKKNSLRASLFRIIFGFDGSHILTGDKELSLVDNASSNWTSILGKMLRKVELGLQPDAS